MLAELPQAVTAPSNHTLMDALVGGVLVLTQLGTVWVSHLKGKRGTKTAAEGLDRRFTTLGADLRLAIDLRADGITRDMAVLSGEMKDLKAYVIGPDGQNGLRGDVRELKADVKGLMDREPKSRRR